MEESPEASVVVRRPPGGRWRSLARRSASLFTRWAGPGTRFLRLAWPGAAAGLAVAALFFPVYGGLCAGTGLGVVVDVAGVLLVALVALTLATLILLLLLVLVRRIPLRFLALLLVTFGSLLALAGPFGFSHGFALRLGSPPIVLSMLAGAGAGILLRRRSTRAGVVSCVLAGVLLLGAVTGAGLLVYWLALPGEDPFLPAVRAANGSPVPGLDAPDPSQPGSYDVATLFYGSGTDRHRPEYGPAADLKTDPVDASAFLTNLKGFRAWARRKYWGFDAKSFPLNARVWYPQGAGPFPLVLIVHGNHKMEESSDRGYAYLGELLAGRGYILASIDENFLNTSWTGDLGGENHVRGWLLLKHLELWRTWNEQEANPFHQRVDLSHIALIGHSRGGEAITHAAAFNRLAHYPDDARITFDFGFAIQTLIAIAPIDGQYEPVGLPTPVENVNYLVLQGSHDADVDFFAGARAYRRVKFTDGNYWIKSALYIHRANHGQFNTVWGRADAGPPLKHLLARGALLNPADQQRIAQVYIAAFLEATLHGRREYLPLFRDHRRAASWLPDTVYLNRFEDSHLRVVSDFDGSIDVTRTTVAGGTQSASHLGLWRHQQLEGRNGWSFQDRAVVLGWNTTSEPNLPAAAAPGYTITLPDGLARRWQIDRRTLLSFCLADTDETCAPPADGGPVEVFEPNEAPQTPGTDEDQLPLDLTLELTASDGATARVPLSHIRPIQPALRVTFTKWRYWERVRYKSTAEPVLQTFEVPLSDFVEANPAFDPGRLGRIRFCFDRTKAAVILLDQVGFVREPDAASD